MYTARPALTFKTFTKKPRLLPVYASDPSSYQPQRYENKSHHHNEGHEVQQPSHAYLTPMEAYYASVLMPALLSEGHGSAMKH
jgi:hypothetical protein